MATWKRDFASGLVVLAPLLVTLYVVIWIYNSLARVPIPVSYPPLRVLLTLLVFVLLVFAIGYLMRTAFGAVVESAIDGLINQLPGLRVVYNASKMAVETALSGTEELQAPVKVETWSGLRMTAFKTGQRTADGRELLFLPTAPNITSGYVIEVEPGRYTESDESVEDALTRVLSAGFGETNDVDLGELLDERSRPSTAGDGESADRADGDRTGTNGSDPAGHSD